MTETESVYRQHDGRVVLDLVLRSVSLLFNNLDPAPFQEKELDAEAEEYIYSFVDDIPCPREVEMIVYLPAPLVTPSNQDAIVKGIRNHFRYMVASTEKQHRRLFRRGRIVLLIGLSVLFFSLLARQILPSVFPASHASLILQESILIVGWVALWEPITIFLYDWWPILHRRKMYEKIVAMEIFVRPIPENGLLPVPKRSSTPESLGAL